MPRFAANLSFLFPEIPFLARFEAAARVGFRGVECLFPYDFPAAALAERLHASGLDQVLFNLPAGDWDAGERGLAAIPGREAAFAAGVERALAYARVLNCRQVHAPAGIPPASLSRQACEAVYIHNLRYAAELLKAHGIRLLIEPINNVRDIPGYFLNTATQARQIIEAVGSDNLFLQMDLYHCQIMTGDLAESIRQHFGHISHFQIAGNPGRHEPDVGEINYPYLFTLIDELGYTGWIACEYRPRRTTLAGLGWAQAYGIGESTDA
jgi:hydroxypyruvate isomerase